MLIAIDQNTINIGRGRTAFLSATALLDRLAPEDRVGVVAFPRGPRLEFTADRKAVDDTLQRVIGTAQHTLNEVQLSPTERAGHGRELARQAAGTGRPLVVSVSGDGGYNEVVDGVMHADNPDVVCAVMAAGNANDHRRATGEQPLAEVVVAGDVSRIDLLRLTVGAGARAPPP